MSEYNEQLPTKESYSELWRRFNQLENAHIEIMKSIVHNLPKLRDDNSEKSPISFNAINMFNPIKGANIAPPIINKEKIIGYEVPTINDPARKARQLVDEALA
jgi:hypothetical protein